MNLQLESPVLALAAGQLVTLDDARGTRIQSRQGTLWITEEGALEDFVVGPGEDYRVSRCGRTLLQALNTVQVEFAEGDLLPCATFSLRGRATSRRRS